MAIPKKLTNFLEKNKINYEPIEHRTVYTAFDKAQTLKVPEKIVGKTLVVKLDPIGKPSASYGASKNYGLVLIPANKNLDKGKLKSAFAKASADKKVAKVKNVELVKEAWMRKNLKGMKVGAVPPFGNLFKMATFVDRSLINQSKIIVNGGDWNWSIKINPTHFKKLTLNLVIGNFTKKR